MAEDAFPDELADPPHSGTLKARRSLDDTEMDITPMIDITFLLLIFFIVASKMDEAANVPLPPAKSTHNVVVKECVIVTVGVGDTPDQAKVYAGDGDAPEYLIEWSDISELETKLETYVTEQVDQDRRKKTVLIKGAKGVKHKHISTTAKATARVAEITDMAWAVEEAQ